MNTKRYYQSYAVLFSVILLLSISLIIPVYAIREIQYNQTNVRLNENDISSIVYQKLHFLNKNNYSLHRIHTYYGHDHSTPLFYLIQLKPTGFMIITSDLGLPPVLSYSFTSELNMSSKEHMNYITLITSDIFNRIQKQNSDKKYDKHSTEWEYLLKENKEIQQSSSFQQWPPTGYSTTGGWIETQWDQNSPFNDFCPLDLSSGDRGLAGCPAVAIAQILHYHKTINNIQFDNTDDYTHDYVQYFQIDDDHNTYDFPSFPELNGYLSTVQSHFNQGIDLTNVDKAALLFACGTAAKQVYTPQVSGTFGVSQAFDAYQKFKCNESVLLTSEDEDIYDRIIQNIKTGLPVHFAIVDETVTTGHNLIIDGYNTNDYYHLNFGWKGAYDGWYDLPDELPFELTFIEGVIVDILMPTSIADLEVSGSIQLLDITPGSTVSSSFTIFNSGEINSELEWEIESYPEWGSWEFSQTQGTGLTPEVNNTLINVNITVPTDKEKTFTGGIKIVNKNEPKDFAVIPLSITTPMIIRESFLTYLLNHLCNYHPVLYQILIKIIS